MKDSNATYRKWAKEARKLKKAREAEIVKNMIDTDNPCAFGVADCMKPGICDLSRIPFNIADSDNHK